MFSGKKAKLWLLYVAIRGGIQVILQKFQGDHF